MFGVPICKIKNYRVIRIIKNKYEAFVCKRQNFSGLCRWLRQEKGVRVFVEPAVKNELIKESQYFEFVETCETGGKLIP